MVAKIFGNISTYDDFNICSTNIKNLRKLIHFEFFLEFDLCPASLYKCSENIKEHKVVFSLGTTDTPTVFPTADPTSKTTSYFICNIFLIFSGTIFYLQTVSRYI